MTVPGMTAEWNCTRCGSTNRKLVPTGTEQVRDRCVSCRVKHIVQPGDRPVRWEAKPAG